MQQKSHTLCYPSLSMTDFNEDTVSPPALPSMAQRHIAHHALLGYTSFSLKQSSTTRSSLIPETTINTNPRTTTASSWITIYTPDPTAAPLSMNATRTPSEGNTSCKRILCWQVFITCIDYHRMMTPALSGSTICHRDTHRCIARQQTA